MVLIPQYGSALFPAANEQATRCVQHWRSRDLSVHAPLSGHVGVFSRGATGTFVDQLGVSQTAVNAEPRWDPFDLDGDTVRETMTLLATSSDRLRLGSVGSVGGPIELVRGTMGFYLRFIETGARSVASSCLAYLGNDAQTGFRAYLDTSGSYYRATLTDGTTTKAALLSGGASVQPSSGQEVELFAQVYDDFSVQLWQSINRGAWVATSRTTAWASPPALGASPYVRLNSRGTGNGGQGRYIAWKIIAGLTDTETARTIT